MEHPAKHLIIELVDALARRDRLRAEEVTKTLLDRGWRVVVERVEPPKPRREAQAEAPVPLVGGMSPAEEAIHLRNRPKGFRGPGIS
jgi:hypothetical protein